MTSRTTSVVERLREIADQLENDRREPDKVLCAVQNLRRLATDIEFEQGSLLGLPADLEQVLRDQSIIVPQDQVLWDRIGEWRNASSGTASADLEAE